MANKCSRGLWPPALLTLFVLVSALAGCTAITPLKAPAMPADEPPAPGVTTGESLTETALTNATYSGIYEAPITLTDGLYEGEPYVAGDAARPIVQFKPNSALYGDLDGDGVEDAAVFLVERGGGSGAFVYVAAQLNQDGKPIDGGAVRIEDRIQIISATIDQGRIDLEVTTEGPGDAACCRSHRVLQSYALQDGKLTDVSAPDAPITRVSAADLVHTAWILTELSEEQPVPAGAGVTIRFTEDAFSGSGGCNEYSGSYTLNEDNPFIIALGPIVATQKACPEAVADLEAAYFAALDKITLWGYDIGDLALAYVDDQGEPSRLLFAAAE